MATARELITRSLSLIGVVAQGETPEHDELNDALLVLNDMIDAWPTERLMLFAHAARTTYTMTANTGTYTLGSGGTFSGTRPPTKLEKASIVVGSGEDEVEYPMRPLTHAQWTQLSMKNVRSDIPSAFYYNPTYPLGYLYLWPIPTAANSVAIYADAALSALTLDTTIALPPGYAKAMRYLLALELAPEFGRKVPPSVAAIALEQKGLLKSTNIKPDLLMTVDPSLLQFPATGAGGINVLAGRAVSEAPITVDLGGSRTIAVNHTTWTPVESYRTITLLDTDYEGRTLEVSVDLWALNGAVSVQARLYNITTAASVGVSAVTTATSSTTVTFTIALTAGTNDYRLELLSSPVSEDMYAVGTLRSND